MPPFGLVREDPMLLTSKFPGTCLKCAGRIAVGDRVSWINGRRGAEHAACSEEGKGVIKAVETSRATDAEIDVPAPDGLEYLPYQRAGIAYALGRKGTLIGDEMGLGKTIQAIGIVNADPAIRKVLVISPKSLTLNWVREFRRWSVRHLTIGMTPGTSDIVVVSYETAKKHEQSLSLEWDLLVVDEAHLIKNPKAQRTKTVHAIAKAAKRRIALTGTPIANRPIELFSILSLVAPEEWDKGGKGFFPFAKRYAGAYRGRFGWDFRGASNLPELQERLRSTCMIRRLKKDVLTELPAKRRQVIEVETNGASAAVKREAEAWSRHEHEITALRAEVELARAADSTDVYASAVARLQDRTRAAFTEMSLMRHETAVAKAPKVVDFVREALEDNDSKVVVFAHHKDVIEILTTGLADLGAVQLVGDTALEDRQRNVERFQSDPLCRVFVGSITAAGVGITLTAASHVVMAELDWVPGNVTQAEDRCHRIGQTQSVLIQHLVLDGSVDARMAHVLVAKQAVADKGLDLAVAREPVLPGTEPATTSSRTKLDQVAAELAPEQVATIHDALRRLAGLCDGASSEDGMGFAKIDVQIGHSLAQAPRLSPRQAALGLKLCRKYRRQIGDLGISAGA